MKTFEDHAREILALAWARLDTPLWSARYDMEAYLRENFVLKETPSTCTREGDHLCRINGPCNGFPKEDGNWETKGNPKNVFTTTGPLRTPKIEEKP